MYLQSRKSQLDTDGWQYRISSCLNIKVLPYSVIYCRDIEHHCYVYIEASSLHCWWFVENVCCSGRRMMVPIDLCVSFHSKKSINRPFFCVYSFHSKEFINRPFFCNWRWRQRADSGFKRLAFFWRKNKKKSVGKLDSNFSGKEQILHQPNNYQ